MNAHHSHTQGQQTETPQSLTRALAAALLWMFANVLIACGLPPTSTENPLDTLKPTLFEQAHLIASVSKVDCTLSDGSNSQCYSFQFKSNPTGHGGPYCPKTDKDVAGVGIYDGKTNPGFQVLKATLWNAMKADGFEVVDESGQVKIVDPGAGGMGGPPPGGPPPGEGPGAACLEASPNDQLTLTFLIPANPVLLDTPQTIARVELVGLSLDGIPINGPPPTVAGDGGGMPGGGGAIPAIDPCGGHLDPAGYYHLHFGAVEMNNVLKAYDITDVTCSKVGQSSTAMIGYAKDGHPIYASKDKDGSAPTNLDECQGHTTATTEYPDGVYHYHVSSSKAPNLPTCLKGAAAKTAFTRN